MNMAKLKKEAEEILKALGKSPEEIEEILEKLNDENLLKKFIEQQRIIREWKEKGEIKVKKPDTGFKTIGEAIAKSLGATKEEAVQKFISKFKVVDSDEYKEIDEQLKKKEEENLTALEKYQNSRWTLMEKDETLEQRIEKLEKRVDELKKRFSTFEERIEKLEKRVDDLHLKLDDLSSKLDDLTSKLDELRSKLDDRSIDVLTSNLDVRASNVDVKTSNLDETHLSSSNLDVQRLREIDGRSLTELGQRSWFWKSRKNELINSGIVEIIREGRKRIVRVRWDKLDDTSNLDVQTSNLDVQTSNLDETHLHSSNLDVQTSNLDETTSNLDVQTSNLDVQTSNLDETHLHSSNSSKFQNSNTDEGKQNLDDAHLDLNERSSEEKSFTKVKDFSFNNSLINNSLNSKKEIESLNSKKEIEEEKESKEHEVQTNLIDFKETPDFKLQDSLDSLELEKSFEDDDFEELSDDKYDSFETEIVVLKNKKVSWREMVEGRYYWNGEEYSVPEEVVKIVRYIDKIAKSRNRNKTKHIIEKVEKGYLDILVKFDYVHPETYLPLDYERRKEIVFKKFVDDEIYEIAKGKWKTIKREHIAGLLKVSEKKGISKEKLKDLIAFTQYDYYQFKRAIETLDVKFLPKIIPVQITDEPFESYLLRGSFTPDRRIKEGETYDEYVQRIIEGEKKDEELSKMKEVEQNAPVEWIRKLKHLKAVDFRSVKDYLFEEIGETKKFKRLIVFAGKSGIGKTFSALQLALLFAKVRDFLAFVEHPNVDWKVLKELIHTPKGILVIDDLGFGGRKKIDWIIHGIHARRQDPTIITMNLEPIDILIAYGEPVMRRLQESAVWFRVEGLE